MYRFIHAADIHLDSPLRGLTRYEGAPVEEIREASRRALKNLIQLALDEEASFVILSGDVFDSDWRDYNTGLFFINQIARLTQAGIQVFLIAGNHDAISPISRNLKMPENVYTFSTRTFESKSLEKIGVVIHGRSFPGRAVEENWVPSFPEPVKDAFNIGILHTSVSGYAGHDTYAPCTLDSLVNKGYNYWALGHVHKEQVLSKAPWIVFPGNIQGRYIREAGAKGCMLVSVEDNDVVDAEFRELDVLRWYHLVIDTGGGNEDDVLAKFSEQLEDTMSEAKGRTAAVRVTIIGACSAHGAFMKDPEKWRNELKAAAINVGGGGIWLEKIIFATSSSSPQLPDGILQEILDNIYGTDGNEPLLLESGKTSLKKLFEKLPPELTSGDEALSLDDTAWLDKSLHEGMEQLMANMVSPLEER
jgi:DNA repair exonuclease SbcCD nuclease subunit